MNITVNLTMLFEIIYIFYGNLKVQKMVTQNTKVNKASFILQNKSDLNQGRFFKVIDKV